MSKQAASFCDAVCDQYLNMSVVHDTMIAELTSTKPIDPVPLFSGFSLREFGGNYQVASADHSASLNPGAGGNSGRGPQGRA
jgi:hypothetical protein